MRFVNPLPFVADLERSRRFYEGVLGLRVTEAEGAVVIFEGGFAIHEGAALHRTIFGQPPVEAGPWGRGNLVLYFEEPELEAAFARVSAAAEIIHGIEVQAWGQRVFRCRDPDGHIVEIGEPE
ncbi:VOC family protein [Pseudoroseicyclus sp. CXY001]|uniref:VOC family protein n=1 Tax=Pseudoroseicyclus sp. CXY001 TaxID=3242492 RepID=UPI00358DC9BF